MESIQPMTLIPLDLDGLRGFIDNAVNNALSRHVPTAPPIQQPSEDRLLTRAEVAKRLHLTFTTLNALEKRGKLIPVRAERRVLYRESEIERYLNGSTGGKRR